MNLYLLFFARLNFAKKESRSPRGFLPRPLLRAGESEFRTPPPLPQKNEAGCGQEFRSKKVRANDIMAPPNFIYQGGENYMKNFIIILVIIAVLFIGYKTISKKNIETIKQTSIDAEVEKQNSEQQNTPSETPSAMQKNETKTKQKTIQYTANGFEPNSITISVGETVVFVNNGDKFLWVASNPHPEHTNLSVFDQKEGMEKGKSYSYVFEKKGTWGYHNHLSARDEGIIIVE